MMYAQLDRKSSIIAGWNDAIQPWRLAITPNSVPLGDFGDGAFRLTPDGEDEPNLFDWEYGVPLYRFDGTRAVPRTEAEMQADIDALPKPDSEPTTGEILDAMLGVTV